MRVNPSTRPRARGRRSAAEAAGTRERVLRQAQRLFARKGYGATSLRELAKAAGVRMFTIQHHFGSKQRLYAEIVGRWDREVQELASSILGKPERSRQTVEQVVEALFEHFLANRARVALRARASLGEGVPRRLVSGDRHWVRFVNANMDALQLSASGLDTGLLLITLEGILHNHVLATSHYFRLYGRDVVDPVLAARVKAHLTQVILRLVDGKAASRGAVRRRDRRAALGRNRGVR